MYDYYFSQLWPAVRRWPLYTLLGLLGLGAFTAMSLRGYRLLGDDNESTEAERGGPGGHGNSLHGHGTFYHK